MGEEVVYRSVKKMMRDLQSTFQQAPSLEHSKAPNSLTLTGLPNRGGELSTELLSLYLSLRLSTGFRPSVSKVSDSWPALTLPFVLHC